MIELKGVSKGYKGKPVLHNINLTIQSGEFMVLIGASGCGKTTLLKMINKLNSIDQGDILVDGVSVRKIKDTDLRRRIGYVIQNGGLFPHLTVEENIDLVLRISNYPEKDRSTRIVEMLDLVGLEPDQYSLPALRRAAPARGCGQSLCNGSQPDSDG